MNKVKQLLLSEVRKLRNRANRKQMEVKKILDEAEELEKKANEIHD